MKLVLTGGPSGGKTTMAMAIVKAFGEKVAMVPESASILFSGGFKRRDDDFGVRHQQRAIYFVQVEQEAIYQNENPGRLLVCDRGTLDGLAYWPGREDEFFKSLGTSRVDELNRYDYVFHLSTANGLDYNANQNPVRVETENEAMRLNQKVFMAWDGHPSRLLVPNTKSFGEKMAMVLTAVDNLLHGKNLEGK